MMRDHDGRFVLCDRQREILAFAAAFIAEHHFSPTVREILDGISITSTNVVAHHLSILKQEGYVTYERRKARTLRVLHQPVTAREVCDRS